MEGICYMIYLEIYLILRIFSWSSQVDMPIKHSILQDLCTLACNNNLLDLCNVHELPGTPAFDASHVFPPSWRFFPILDPQVISYTIVLLL